MRSAPASGAGGGSVAATAKLFQRTFIQTKPGVQKRHYLEQFASLAFSAKPNGVYSAEIEIAPNQAPPTPRDFVELLIGSEDVDAIPVVPAGTDPPTKFEDLSPEVRRAYEIYPLVDGERILSINLLCLEKDWEGLQQRVVFINRETNLSRAYFAAPGLRADPHTPGVTPALLLLRVPPLPVREDADSVADSDAADDEAQRILGLKIFSAVMDTLSTLSWATPAGPYVAAGVSIIEIIVQALFGVKDHMLDDIQDIVNKAVNELENYLEEQDLKMDIKALSSFSRWTRRIQKDLGDNEKTFRSALLQGNGILSALNGQLDPGEATIFSLLSKLLDDDDLLSDKTTAYESPHRWSMARIKLTLLFLVASTYVTALKIKIILISRLYEGGVDYRGQKLDPFEKNPDNTFAVLVDEVDNLQKELRKRIEHVKIRRREMVAIKASNECLVAYSRDRKPIARRDDWKVLMNDRDALYKGYKNDQMVRAKEDNPGMDQFEFQAPAPKHGFPGRVYYNSWRRLEIRDKAVYDGEHPQDWALSDGYSGSYSYTDYPERAQHRRDIYLAYALGAFDDWAQVPDKLSKGVAELAAKWTPQMPAPEHFHDIAGFPVVDKKWGEKADADELWSDRGVSVRYWFTLGNAIGKESEKSIESEWVDPKGQRQPRIVGLPKKGDYLTYVNTICLYRQFKKENSSGPPKLGPERLVAIMQRVEGQDGFAGELVDEETVKHDKDWFAKG
jgi:hypothetical protein